MKLVVLPAWALLTLFSLVLAMESSRQIIEEGTPSTSFDTPSGPLEPLAIAGEGSSRVTTLPRVIPWEDTENFSRKERIYKGIKSSLQFSKTARSRNKSNKAMATLIKNRPSDVDINPSQLQGRMAKALTWDVIRLPQDPKQASQELAFMTRARKPFYAIDTDNRVWSFQTGRNTDLYTYFESMAEHNQKMVRDAFETKGKELSRQLSGAAGSFHGL
ncbi:conserved hypothetical Ustilaginaceae-specific protein [Sporisorium reilianum SRZ2]|uniref:Conserved hypothetical Ustilaginaceae-specific protein n=1 Tax=Sporisorium reilianum (strain SRZ2) TaxID=999809 RepID=E6ZMA1_SPORE|nr:conserved hypothetical Ustilaginaceae-specific protein [Sporisorium reilianum SRZ2]